MSLPEQFSLLVLGLGTTGLDIARWAVSHLGCRVTEVTVFGGERSEPNEATRALVKAGAKFVFGTEEVEGSYDICVASPGISEFSEFFSSARAHATQIMGEPEFAFRLSPQRWIGVTGTNGKTTTVSLIDHLLRAAGVLSRAVGNIGETAVSQVDERPAGSWFVAELSSYQLATADELHPRVAVLLNITSDHLVWHRGFENYVQAKLRILDHLGADDLAIVDIEDPGVAACAAEIFTPARRVLSTSFEESLVADCADAAFVRSGRLVVRLNGVEHLLAEVDEMRLAGRHNVMNALAAAAGALFVGASDAAVSTGLCSFCSLEHRLESCGRFEGVRYYNDSKATNTDAVEKALTAFPRDRVILLLGGHDKGTPLEDFARIVMDRVSAVVCFGAARRRFMGALAGTERAAEVDIAEADDLRDAVDVARSLACRGDVVLLSPACSSFDEFSSFEERGECFKAYLEELRRRSSDAVARARR